MDLLSKRSKILVVDDIAENRIALQMLLKKLDVEVITADSGVHAIEATLQHDFNLILLDVMMPEMDGYEVAEILHNSNKTAHVPIIFITAMDKNEANETRGYSKGAIDFLFKPVNEVILLSKIKVHLELQKKKEYIRNTLGLHPTERPKILIVDDNQENLLALEKILGKLEADIVQATSGNDALSATLYNDFALIILDVKMPGMDGYEVAEILKFDERTENIPIIFVTVIDNDDDQELRGYEKGAVDYIVKPLNGFILVSKVKIFMELFKIKSALENLVRERNKDLEEANAHLSHHNKRLKAIVHSINKFTSCSDLESFGNSILKEFSAHMGATGGSLYLIEENGLRLIHSLDQDHALGFITFPLAEKSILSRVVESGKPILSEDLTTIEDIKTSGWDGYTNNSILIFPLIDNSSKTVAVLALHNKIEPPFTSHDLEIGSILASYVSETLKGTQFHEALLKSERQYRSLFVKASDAFFIIDRQSYQILDANDSALTLSGFDLESITSLTLQTIIDGDQQRLLEEIKESETASELGQVTIVRKDEAHRIVTLNLIPLDKNASICMAKDITTQLEIEKQMRRVQKMESIGTLAGGIAHDFNNLLSPMLGYSELLLTQVPQGDNTRLSIQEIHIAAKRAKKLVQQILTFSHQESSALAPLKIQPVIKEALALIRSSIPTTVDIRQSISEDCGMINGDPTLIHQIVMNLATNASHAMKGAGGELEVKLASVVLTSEEQYGTNLPPAEYVRLTIADTGIGMDRELEEKIFDPFFTTKAKEEGTGMGLAVVHGIVNKLGGSIKVNSRVGEGSVFLIYLPLSENRSSGRGTPVQVELVKGSAKILFVDDEMPILTMLKTILEQQGYLVTTFSNSTDAFKDFQANPDAYDLVITDLTMPGMTGDKLSIELLKIRPALPILLLTGYGGTFSKERAYEIGIKGFLSKPVELATLTGEIRTILETEREEVPQ